MLTRKVLNNGRTYSCGYVFLWDLGMLAVSKALEEEEFKQTLRYNPKTCVLACFAVLIPKIGDFLRILKSQNTILTILSTDLWISNQWTNPYTLGVWTTPSTMNLSHNLLLIHCTSKILSRSRHIFFDIRYATLHTYQLSALSLAGRDAKAIHIWNQEEDSMHVWAEIETLPCAAQRRNTIMANSIVIIAVICYSTLLYIMDYYGIFIVYYGILLYIYINCC